ncbi:MAG: tetratricopeptide repeat protein, partial [Halobacteriovoraceae bacterium]|nr:tetratricopeptide repeat protein [Halobacteriovoraceae bacterium]
CKTQEQIAQEKKVTHMSVQMVQGQAITAKISARIQDFEERLSSLTGEIEEKNHKTQKELLEEIEELNERIKVLEATNEETQDRFEKQKEYLDEVLKTLANLSGKKPKRKRITYKQSMIHYKKKNYKEAERQFLSLLKNKRIKGNRRARIIHNLGMIKYIRKDYKNASIYFSRLLTQHSKAPYNSNGFLYLGRSFKNLRQKSKAKQTFKELIRRYPKSKHAKQAKRMLKSL